MQTSIIILSYNTKDLLHKCLTGLLNHLPKEKTEVIVVDNASKDESVTMIKNEFPAVILMENSKNLGFGAGINRGVEKARGKYLLFLNSDAMVHDASIERMIELLESDEQIGVAGGLLKYPDGKVQRSYGAFYTLPSVCKMLLLGDKGELWGRTEDKPKSVDWVSGGFMLIRKEIFDTINGFDPYFFMYVEDMELCYRVKQLGYTVYVCPNAVVTHEGHGSSSRSFAIYHIYRGLRYFYKKHRQPWEYGIVSGLLDLKAYLLIALGQLTHNAYLVTTYKSVLNNNL